MLFFHLYNGTLRKVESRAGLLVIFIFHIIHFSLLMQITLFVNKRLPHRKGKSKELNLKENVELIRALVTVVAMNEVSAYVF